MPPVLTMSIVIVCKKGKATPYKHIKMEVFHIQFQNYLT